jgi:hypothetical protein
MSRYDIWYEITRIFQYDRYINEMELPVQKAVPSVKLEPVNRVLEVDLDGDEKTLALYNLPPG